MANQALASEPGDVRGRKGDVSMDQLPQAGLSRLPGQIGAGLLQRKLQRRLAEKRDAAASDGASAQLDEKSQGQGQGQGQSPTKGTKEAAVSTVESGAPESDESLAAFIGNFQSVFSEALVPFLKAMLDPADVPSDPRKPTLTAALMRKLFSDEQRAALTHYFATRLIPPGLFTNAQATGRTSAQQRMFLAGAILTDGVFPKTNAKGAPQDPEKLKATCCGTWVNAVLIYAGCNPATAYAANSPQFIESLTGEITFGGGTLTNPYALHHMPDLKPGESRAERADRYGASQAKPDLIPVADPFDKIAPGDWLYIDNGGAAGHSILFMEWLDSKVNAVEPGQKDPTGNVNTSSHTVRYRTAHHYNQGSPKVGGKAGTCRLGFPFSHELHVSGVTNIQRTEATTTLPKTPDELLNINRGAAVEANQHTIDKAGLDPQRLRDHLAKGDSAILHSDKFEKLEPSQRGLIEGILVDSAAPSVDNITTLVALHQKLSGKNHANVTVNGKLKRGKKAVDPSLVDAGALASMKHKAETKGEDPA